MQHENICKFISDSTQEILSAKCFILETNPEIMMREHSLTTHKAILLTKGEADFVFNSRPYPASAGDLIFGFKQEKFKAVPKGNCEYMYIDFEGGRAEELFRRFEIQKSTRFLPGFEGLIPAWKESLSRATEQTIDLASESILLMIFSRINTTGVQRNDLIYNLLKYLDVHFMNPDLSLDAVAKKFGYNSKYLSHLFKKHMRTGFSEYVKELRIKYAVSLFEVGLDSIKNVALLSGFSDPLYFSSVFKKSIGMAPTEYIEKQVKN